MSRILNKITKTIVPFRTFGKLITNFIEQDIYFTQLDARLWNFGLDVEVSDIGVSYIFLR